MATELQPQADMRIDLPIGSASPTSVTSTAVCRSDTSGSPIRVWVLTNAPSPYQVELLSTVRATQRVDLAVRFMRVPEGLADQLGQALGTSYRKLWGAAPRSWRDEFRLHPRAIREAAFGRFDCYILSGLYTSVTFLACALILTLRGKPWGIWLEQPRSEQYRLAWSRRGLLSKIKPAVLRFLLRNTHRVIGMGTAALNAYRALGAAPEKLSLLPYCCDVERFAHVDPAAVNRIRAQFRLEDKTVFLFSGQMIERKGVDVVLAAFAQFAAKHQSAVLLLLGDGPLRREYEASVAAELRERVHFTGFLDQSQLPAFFAAADSFVFPSRHDGWGVVVNEACAAGLPIIVSRQTGAALDLIEEGLNGFILDCEDVGGFAEKMALLCEDTALRHTLGKNSREIVRRFSTVQGAERFYNCVKETMHPTQMEDANS